MDHRERPIHRSAERSWIAVLRNSVLGLGGGPKRTRPFFTPETGRTLPKAKGPDQVPDPTSTPSTTDRDPSR